MFWGGRMGERVRRGMGLMGEEEDGGGGGEGAEGVIGYPTKLRFSFQETQKLVKSGSSSWKRSEFHICSIATSILCCATTLSSNYRAVS